MNRENIEKFIKFISEDKERQAKAKSFGNDPDALSAYARVRGRTLSLTAKKEASRLVNRTYMPSERMFLNRPTS